MRPRPWHLLLVLAALVVPIQAGALKGEEPVRAGGGLSVSASLDHCGVADSGISCKINVSWTGVEGAERYTASVSLADGSVREMGTIGTGPGGGFSSIWVPYAGDGSYGVTVTAWGTDPDGKEEKLDSDEADAKANGKGKGAKGKGGEKPGDGEKGEKDGAADEEGAAETPDKDPPDKPATKPEQPAEPGGSEGPGSGQPGDEQPQQQSPPAGEGEEPEQPAPAPEPAPDAGAPGDQSESAPAETERQAEGAE